MLSLPPDILAVLSEDNTVLPRVSRSMRDYLRPSELARVVNRKISTREIFDFFDVATDTVGLAIVCNFEDEHESGSMFLHLISNDIDQELSGVIVTDRIRPILNEDLRRLSKMSRNLKALFVNATDHVAGIALGETHSRYGISRECAFFCDLDTVRSILARRVENASLTREERQMIHARFKTHLRNVVESAAGGKCCEVLNRRQIAIDSVVAVCLLKFWLSEGNYLGAKSSELDSLVLRLLDRL